MDSSLVTFNAFVLSLATTAAVHFGDLTEPRSSQPTQPDLDAASHMIEILALLEQKTRGNLAPDEQQLLEQVLYELRVRYVAAKNQDTRIIEP